jgi:hypothetical protein
MYIKKPKAPQVVHEAPAVAAAPVVAPVAAPVSAAATPADHPEARAAALKPRVHVEHLPIAPPVADDNPLVVVARHMAERAKAP